MSKYRQNKDKWVVADFETTTEKFYEEFGNTQVWLYAISDKNGEITHWGKNIEDFIKVLKETYCGYIVYFHNLKFDGSFILNYLINNNYIYKDEINHKDNKCFSTLITEDGQFYQITIHFKQGRTVKIQDSLKILPFKVKKIANDFGLPMKKGSIDYDTYVITPETLDYVFNDVKIVALALNEVKHNGMEYMTTASSAYHYYKSTNPFMNSYFPILDKQFLLDYRNAYRGGRSQVNPKYSNIILENVRRFDINSMYPYIMYSQQLPYGQPIKINKIGKYKFELYKIKTIFRLKKNHLPTLLVKNSIYAEVKYYINTDECEPETIYISNIDYELLVKHYDIDYIEFEEMYGFNTCDYLFKNYIDIWYKIKNENKGAKKQVAKMMLNSLYGKFGSNCEGYTKIPKLDDSGALTFENSEIKDKSKYYLPIAIAITSYAHRLIDNAICETGYNNFVYCDTDSVHTLGLLPQELIDNKELGKFKLEGIEHKSKYVRQKTYVYSEIDDEGNTEYTITCAGMDDNSKKYAIDKYGEDIFNVFGVGFTIEGFKLVPKQVKGGIILCKTTFQIKG